MHSEPELREYWRIDFRIYSNDYTDQQELTLVYNSVYSTNYFIGYKMRNPQNNRYIFNSWVVRINLFQVKPFLSLDKLSIAMCVNND